MFNPLTPAELVLALGRALKDAADTEAPRDEYGRGQLLSAYSVARHLSAEQSCASELRGWFKSEIEGALDTAARSAGSSERGTRLHAHAARVRAAGDAAEIGDALCELLAGLRSEGEISEGLRREVRIRLRELADREVAGLSHPPS